ncbi:MAG: DUF971 domain-containing protein [Nitratireductor sp.]
MQHDQNPKPTELRVSKDKRELTIGFANGDRFTIPAELLRVQSPSAEVQGHSPEQRKLIVGKRNVEILQILPTGNYAVRIVFDDMHDTGIFTWSYLHEMGSDVNGRMAAYEAELAEKGLKR